MSSSGGKREQGEQVKLTVDRRWCVGTHCGLIERLKYGKTWENYGGWGTSLIIYYIMCWILEVSCYLCIPVSTAALLNKPSNCLDSERYSMPTVFYPKSF